MDAILILDTNAYGNWRRSGAWRENLALADAVIVPSIVLGELFHGFRRGRCFERNFKRLEEFLGEPQVRVGHIDKRVAERYGEAVAFLRQRGTPIPTNDIWIGAVAMELGGELATHDDHFDELPQVRRAVRRD